MRGWVQLALVVGGLAGLLGGLHLADLGYPWWHAVVFVGALGLVAALTRAA